MNKKLNANEEIVRDFYQAFQQKNGDKMAALYSDSVIFSDAVFGKLSGPEAGAMWQMLTTQAQSLEITFEIQEQPLGEAQDMDKNMVVCQWVATYLFSKTKRKVVNHVTATLKVSEGKIVEHRDQFDFYLWAKQAFGLAGWLIGWTKSFQLKVQTSAHLGLKSFMKKKTSLHQK